MGIVAKALYHFFELDFGATLASLRKWSMRDCPPFFYLKDCGPGLASVRRAGDEYVSDAAAPDASEEARGRRNYSDVCCDIC